MIKQGAYASITDLAKAEGVNQSYACRLLRLTLLSPAIVETILDGRQVNGLQLAHLQKPFPVLWDEQANRFSARNLYSGARERKFRYGCRFPTLSHRLAIVVSLVPLRLQLVRLPPT